MLVQAEPIWTAATRAANAVGFASGLRERLAIEIAAFPAAHRDRMERARNLASRLHAADSRQREPYVNHLLRVTIRIISHYRVRDPDVACAALLHDAVEDHAGDSALGAEGRPEALAVLAARFGDRVAGPGGRGHQPHLPGQAGTSMSNTASMWPPTWK